MTGMELKMLQDLPLDIKILKTNQKKKLYLKKSHKYKEIFFQDHFLFLYYRVGEDQN